MALAFLNLFSWRGTVGRVTYAATGLIGFALKLNLDRFVAAAFFNRKWSILDYWAPLDRVAAISSLSRSEMNLLLVFAGLSLPFIWVGIGLTIRRLRDVQLPPWLAFLFFIPLINVLFFLVLSILPSRHPAASVAPPRAQAKTSFLARLIPESKLGSAGMSVLVVLAFGLPLVWFCTQVLQTYGWSLFMALPFGLGLLATLLFGFHARRSIASCITVALLANLLLGVALLALAIEGFICLIMAAPIGAALGGFGGWVGYLLQRRPQSQVEAPAMLILILAFLPGAFSLENAAAPAPPLLEVRTTLEINAPPEIVWHHVTAFSEIAPPSDWLFRLGIAYPIRARLDGVGPGATRHCEFSTGSFVEPIQIWDAPRRLKFSVTSNPAPMEEWTPYRTIHPPHLEGFLQSKGGEFHLIPLPGNRTRVEATTWYHHSMWPASYWQLWSDAIIHRIHLRVLRHIAQNAEQPAREREGN